MKKIFSRFIASMLAGLVARLFVGRNLFRLTLLQLTHVGLKPNLRAAPKPIYVCTVFTVLLATLALNGCTSNILESKIAAPQIYVLRNNNAGTAKIAYPVQLRIALPSAAPGINTERIAVLRNGNQLDYYYGARWGGTAPQVVQSFLINLLQSQQGYKNVVTDISQVGADYILEIDLQHFQAEYANDSDAPIVHVALTATVFEVKSRKSLATLQAIANETPKDNRLGAVVIAFQSATHAASVSLSEQLESTVGKALLK